jgi:hypothetical protein
MITEIDDIGTITALASKGKVTFDFTGCFEYNVPDYHMWAHNFNAQGFSAHYGSKFRFFSQLHVYKVTGTSKNLYTGDCTMRLAVCHSYNPSEVQHVR